MKAIVPLSVTIASVVWMICGDWHINSPLDGTIDRFLVGALMSSLVWAVWGVMP